MNLGLILQIFIISFVYVTLSTIRLMLTMKGYRFLAPMLSMVEIVIYVTGLNIVMSSLDNPLNLASYAIGYGVGIALGIKIEDWLALGYTMLTVMTADEGDKMAEKLWAEGYGVTIVQAKGRSGNRLVLHVLATRKKERELVNHVLEIDEKAFIYSSDPKYVHGGFWSKRVKK